MTAPAFAERYLVARFDSGGVVVDLETGNYFRVDPVTAEVCEVMTTATGYEDAVAQVSQRRRLPPDDASRIVDDVQAGLALPASRGTPQGSYHFYPEAGGFVLRDGSRRVLTVDGRALEVDEVPGSGAAQSPRLEDYVSALTPKLMFLRGLTVLHASACARNGRLVAFTGVSGAGKTTTARAFSDAGAQLVAEDLLVLVPGTTQPAAALEGEARAFGWARDTAAALARGESAVSSDALRRAADGSSAPLDTILFLDRTRRSGVDFTASSLSAPDGLIALMANDFLGASSRDEWRRYFTTAVRIASDARLLLATAPLGNERLSSAARIYMSTWTS
jgi:hypothetical protein